MLEVVLPSQNPHHSACYQPYLPATATRSLATAT